jgi:peptide/nickel transport system ATP-binding protein
LSAAGDNLLQIQNLSVAYSQPDGTPLRALEKVSLSIRSGEIVAILGESGCGKSTLANAVAGLLPRTGTIEQGQIFFKDLNLCEIPEAQLRAVRGRKIARVPQDPMLALNPVLKSGTQIEEVLRAHLSMGRAERKERVLDLLREMDFENPERIADSYPHQLSGGQRQRIVIAQAIACEPELLIADEPTSKLDASLRVEIADVFSRLHQKHGMAVLLISHDVAFVASIAHRIVLMYAGRVVETASRSAMIARPLHPYGQQLLELARTSVVTTSPLQQRFSFINGDHEKASGSGCCFEPRCRDRMAVCDGNLPGEMQPEAGRIVSCFKYGE